MNSYSAISLGASPREGEFAAAEDDLTKAKPFVSVMDIDSPMETESHRPLRDAIGVAGSCILALGTAAIITAMTLLGLLWQGAEIAASQGNPSQTWQNVVDAGWAPVAVTICSAALRTAISLQAGLAVSMVASILLEHRYVKLGDTAFLSIIRAVSIQPGNLMVFGGRSILRSLGVLGLPLLIVATLIALASTFTSSILLSDFGDIIILGNFNTSMIGYGNESIQTALDIWRSSPVQYARFAEYTDSNTRAAGPHIDDTGITLRVPIPMAAMQERETLREYTGPATVFDHRVACVAPQELRILSFNETRTLMNGGETVGPLAFGGYATFDTNLPPPLLGAEPGKQIPFTCLLPRTEATAGLQSNITVCVARPPFSTEESPSSPFRLAPFLPLEVNLTVFIPPIYFIFNITPPNRPDNWVSFANERFPSDQQIEDTTGFTIPQTALSTTRNGPWTTTVINTRFLENATFSASACVSLHQGFAFNVTLHSTTPAATEPTLGWTGSLRPPDPNPPPDDDDETASNTVSTSTYSTAAILHQLNASLPVSSRGIMSLLLSSTNWTSPLDTSPSFLLSIMEAFPVLNTVPLCALECQTNPSAVMAIGRDNDVGHPAHVMLFHDALAQTQSPAKALQAWLTTLTRQRYYDAFGRYTTGAEAKYAHSISVFAPRGWAGFWAVVGMVVCHFVVVGVAIWVFSKRTRHSLLGNAWLAVAQVVSGVTGAVLDRATGMRDGEVAVVVKGMGQGMEGRYGVLRERKTGRVEVGRV
ncbi:hypothetical protein OQA88_9396 [Cercophora sp. LCS_1]